MFARAYRLREILPSCSRALNQFDHPLRLPRRLRDAWRGLRRLGRFIVDLPRRLREELDEAYPLVEYIADGQNEE